MNARLEQPGPLVCIVEDDGAVRSALEFALDLEGFTVETFESGEALLLRTPLGDPCCLVIDERLPGVSGLDTLRQLRARGIDTPAVIITSHPNARLREAAAAAGVPILEKPLLPEILIGAIRRCIADGASPA
jgi:FixJ family two-component response regulator